MINLPGCIVLPPRVAKNVQIRKKTKTGAIGGTSKYYGNMMMRCLFIVFRPLLYEIKPFQVGKMFQLNIISGFIKKNAKFRNLFLFQWLGGT